MARRDPGVRPRLDALISELSSAFVRIPPGEVGAEIERWIERLLHLIGVDRISVGELAADGKALRTTHTSPAEGGPPLVVQVDSQLPWYVEQLRHGRPLRLERLPDDLPPEAVAERAYVARAGMKSHLMLPFRVGGTILGGIGFSTFGVSRTWPQPLVEQLQLASEVLGNALARGRAWRELEDRLAFERLITELVTMLVTAASDQLDERIHEALGRLIVHFGVDLSMLARFSDEGTRLVRVHSARADSAPAGPSFDAQWYLRELRSRRVLNLGRIPDDLPAGAGDEGERWSRDGLLSHLAIPLVTDESVWGMIAFGAFRRPRGWTDEEVQRLRLLGEIMMGALLRGEAEEATHRQRDELAHLARVGALGELTAALAHELGTPLAAILANAQASRRHLAAGRLPANLDEVFGDIAADATRSGDLIRRLHDLLRRRQMQKVALDLNHVLRAVESIASTEARRHGARLDFQLGSVLPRVVGDPVQLQQVVLNLVRNAAEAMTAIPSNARRVVVGISAEASGHLVVSVEDVGPPIDDATLEKMFSPFHTTKPDGLGMGLPISRAIIEAHGGSLRAHRRPQGGLIVQFTLPVAAQARS